jgi:hypothetical protein
MLFVYRLHAHFEKEKWDRIATAFFDQTGKRVSSTLLMDRLGDAKFV